VGLLIARDDVSLVGMMCLNMSNERDPLKGRQLPETARRLPGWCGAERKQSFQPLRAPRP
jgi:hypothetical protein